MKIRSHILISLLSVLVATFAAQAAVGLSLYNPVVGTNVSFTGIQESSSFGDPEPLFGQPTGSGNQLLFFPPQFLATAAGGTFDQTGSQLQLTVAGNGPTDTITTILIDEFGDALLLGSGTAATGTYASMSGFVTVLEDINGPITPVVIGFVGTFSPSAMLALPGDAGTTLWSGSVAVDVAAQVPNATKAFLSFDNDLTAFSEVGTSAKIQKKVVDGPAIVVTVIPEPTTGALLSLGLVGLVLFKRTGAR